MVNWTVDKGYFYPGSPGLEGLDAGDSEMRERLRRKKALDDSRRSGPLDKFVKKDDLNEEATCLKGVKDMMRLVKGLKEVKLVYSQYHKKCYSGNISDSLDAEGVLSYIRKWECHFGWKQHNFEWKRDKAIAIRNGDRTYCDDYVHYKDWCACSNHH